MRGNEKAKKGRNSSNERKRSTVSQLVPTPTLRLLVRRRSVNRWDAWDLGDPTSSTAVATRPLSASAAAKPGPACGLGDELGRRRRRGGFDGCLGFNLGNDEVESSRSHPQNPENDVGAIAAISALDFLLPLAVLDGSEAPLLEDRLGALDSSGLAEGSLRVADALLYARRDSQVSEKSRGRARGREAHHHELIGGVVIEESDLHELEVLLVLECLDRETFLVATSVEEAVR